MIKLSSEQQKRQQEKNRRRTASSYIDVVDTIQSIRIACPYQLFSCDALPHGPIVDNIGHGWTVNWHSVDSRQLASSVPFFNHPLFPSFQTTVILHIYTYGIYVKIYIVYASVYIDFPFPPRLCQTVCGTASSKKRREIFYDQRNILRRLLGLIIMILRLSFDSRTALKAPVRGSLCHLFNDQISQATPITR